VVQASGLHPGLQAGACTTSKRVRNALENGSDADPPRSAIREHGTEVRQQPQARAQEFTKLAGASSR
jgi:hypothetical protein